MSRSKRWVLTALAMATASGLLAGCSGAAVQSNGGSSATSSVIDTSNCTDGFNTIGITNKTVTIGQSAALSGAGASAVPLGYKAYIDLLNSKGGVKFGDGKIRKIKLIVLDDGYEPARARANVDQLVNQNKVFAISGQYGTATGLAARPVNSEACTPSVYQMSGSDEFGNPAFPWTLAPVGPPNSADARAAVDFIASKNANAKIGLLYQNDDFGKTLLGAFNDELAKTKVKVADKESFNPTDTAVSGQITTLAGSGATDFVMFSGAGSFQLQALQSIAQSSWKPGVKYLTSLQPNFLDQLSVPAATNVYFSQWTKNANDPSTIATDKEMQLFLKWYYKQPGSNALNPAFGQNGWVAAQLLEATFKAMKQPTRTSLIDATRDLKFSGASLMRDGITWDMNWPKVPFGVLKEAILTYDPEGAAGRKFKDVKTVDLGNVKYQNYLQ